MKKDDTAYLKHIRDAISRIEAYLQDKTYQEFSENCLVQDGAIRQLEIIGEATKKLSDSVKAKYPEIPWKDIAGMRDKLIHDYLGVDIDAVWDTIQKDIPVLKKKLKTIFSSLS